MIPIKYYQNCHKIKYQQNMNKHPTIPIPKQPIKTEKMWKTTLISPMNSIAISNYFKIHRT